MNQKVQKNKIHVKYRTENMRRKDREITDLATMEAIIAESKFCRMAHSENVIR
jgi:hypothetical protein